MEQNIDKDYLVLKDITKIFSDDRGNEVTAVDNISLTIKKGNFVTLLGPSGCGKTTTLRMVAGFEIQTSGDITLADKLINNVAPFDRNMPMVFQSYALFPHLTIFENIAYGLKIRKLSKEVIKNDVAMVSQMVNLVGLENRYPGELSGGQQQRVALARALVLKPEIILFDEPLSNLDAKLRIQTRTEIKRVQQMMGITALYVTHDQSEALSMSDQIIIMNRGEIAQVGSPEEIYNHPNSSFVADFIGNANFIDAKVSEINSKSITVTAQGKSLVVEKTDEEFIEGEEVSLAIKPEAVDISLEPTGFTGNLDVSSFLGSITEYKIEFENSFITAVHSNTTGHPMKNFKMGEQVHVDFQKDFFHIYKK
ncbi:MAG: ABC transporter ATP-binding protein [Spirochaetia bacterium]|jgi:iron(III) transport system ATP-binding protein|nr:ABC transporter ATP-binding protein [Spirochaetia bacterium]